MVIDLHCHVLPALDDGPQSVAEALAMARIALNTGTDTLVATPHIDTHWRVSPSEIRPRAEALSRSLRDGGIELDLATGGEIALSRYVDLDEDELDLLRLGSGPYLLLECPLSPTAGDFDVLLARLCARGESIVLAHPERSPLFQKEPERLAALLDAGVLCSLTAGSIRGEFGGRARLLAIELLRNGFVHNVASDCHDAQRRTPGLDDALAYAEAEVPGISSQRDWLTSLVPAAILAGEPLPQRPA
jgi:protein-tyrosine phosphatase